MHRGARGALTHALAGGYGALEVSQHREEPRMHLARSHERPGSKRRAWTSAGSRVVREGDGDD